MLSKGYLFRITVPLTPGFQPGDKAKTPHKEQQRFQPLKEPNLSIL